MAEWKNKIIGYKEMDPKELKANARNWRKHPPRQVQALTKSLDKVGWVDAVKFNTRTGQLFDGHARVEQAIKNKESMIPVLLADLTEEEEKLVLATFDPIGALAETDKEALDRLRDEINSNEFDSIFDAAQMEDDILSGLDLGDGSIESEDPLEKFTIMIPVGNKAEALKQLRRVAADLDGYLVGV